MERERDLPRCHRGYLINLSVLTILLSLAWAGESAALSVEYQIKELKAYFSRSSSAPIHIPTYVKERRGRWGAFAAWLAGKLEGAELAKYEALYGAAQEYYGFAEKWLALAEAALERGDRAAAQRHVDRARERLSVSVENKKRSYKVWHRMLDAAEAKVAIAEDVVFTTAHTIADAAGLAPLARFVDATHLAADFAIDLKFGGQSEATVQLVHSLVAAAIGETAAEAAMRQEILAGGVKRIATELSRTRFERALVQKLTTAGLQIPPEEFARATLDRLYSIAMAEGRPSETGVRAFTRRGEGMLEELSREVGDGAVFLTVGDRGLTAISGDGRWSRQLVAGVIDQAVHDPELDLVWFVRNGRLEVFDLRDSKAAPIVIIGGMPDGVFEVRRTAAQGVISGTIRVTSYLSLQWGKTPRIEALRGIYGEIWDDDETKQALDEIRKAKLVGAEWLIRQVDRWSREVPRITRNAQRVVLPRERERCSDRDVCGANYPFGSAGWLLVIAQHSCGDACHVSCLIHDPKRGVFATPPEGRTWHFAADVQEAGPCGPYFFDKSAQRFLIGETVCSLDGNCRKLDGRAIGWLDAGPTIDLDS